MVIITINTLGHCHIFNNIDEQLFSVDKVRMTLMVKDKIYTAFLDRKERFKYIGSKFTSTGYLYDWFRLDDKLVKNKQKDCSVYDCIVTHDNLILQFDISGRIYTVEFKHVDDILLQEF